MQKSSHFFQLDQTSSVIDGMVYFRYMLYTVKNKDSRNAYDYPIFVALSPYNITFYIDYPYVHKLFVLPLTAPVHAKNNLTKQLKKMVNQPILSAKIEDLKFNDREYSKKILDDINKIATYSQVVKENNVLFKYKKAKEPKPLTCQQLFLDFLYDFEYGSVFQKSPHYEIVRQEVNKNFLWNAIVAKLDYHYYRILYLQAAEELLQAEGEEQKQAEKTAKYYAIHLGEAEVQWSNILRAKEATEVINQTNHWFKDIETEHKCVFFWKKEVREDDRQSKTESRKKGRTGWRKCLKQKTTKEQQKQEQEQFATQDHRNITESAKWFLRRYNVWGALSIAAQHSLLWRKMLFLVTLTSFLTICFYFYFNQICLNNYECIDKLWVGMACLPFIAITLIAITIFVLTCIFFILKRINAFRKEKIPDGINHFFIFCIRALFMPRLVLAIISAWLLFLSTEELWKINFDVELNNCFVYTIISLVIFLFSIFVYVKVYDVSKEIGTIRRLSRVIFMLGISFSYSVMVGFFTMDMIAPKMLARSGYLTDFYAAIAVNGQTKSQEDKKVKSTDTLVIKSIITFVQDTIPSSVTIIPLRSGTQKDSLSLPQISAKIKLQKGGLEAKQILLDSMQMDIVILTTKNSTQKDTIDVLNDIDRSYPFATDELKRKIKDIENNVQESKKGDAYFQLLAETRIVEGGAKIMYTCDFGVPFLGKRTFRFFPGMLLLDAVFVMFIGIFTQLLLGDKPMTEPI